MEFSEYLQWDRVTQFFVPPCMYEWSQRVIRFSSDNKEQLNFWKNMKALATDYDFLADFHNYYSTLHIEKKKIIFKEIYG